MAVFFTFCILMYKLISDHAYKNIDTQIVFLVILSERSKRLSKPDRVIIPN